MPDAAYLIGLLQAVRVHATPAMLPSGQPVEISTMLRSEKPWPGSRPEFPCKVPNKQPLQFGGRPMWAEFILLRLLESDGWAGVWVKNWGGRAFWRNPGEPVELPKTAADVFQRIEQRVAGRGGGCWDIFAWCGADVLFIESKKRGRDRLRPTQLTWLEGALAEGMPLSTFAIVEWQAVL